MFDSSWIRKLQYRLADAGSTKAIHGPPWSNASPVWLRLVRKGDQLLGLSSDDGSNWTDAGRIKVAFSDPLRIGLAVTSHAYGITADGTFADWSLTQG